MKLFILAISVLALYFAISVCWKLIRSVLTLPFKIGTETYEHDYFADDETAMWVKGKTAVISGLAWRLAPEMMLVTINRWMR